MRRRTGLVVRIVALLAVAAAGWTGWVGWQLRSDLTVGQTLVTRLQADLLQTGGTTGGTAALPADLAGLQRRADRAAGRTRSPFWSLAEHLPAVGGTFRAAGRTTRSVQVLADGALPPAVAALELLHRGPLITSGRVDLDLLGRVDRQVDRAARQIDAARALLAPHDRWVVGPVASRVDRARVQLARLDAGLHTAVTALRLAPDLLGERGPRRYFVAVQNNAEARATGGLVGAFALLRADHGAITLERSGVDSQLLGTTTHLSADPGAATSWIAVGSTVAWQDVNLTPHFPDVARSMAGLWVAQGGPPVDGVIGLDPLVMSELLQASGGVHLPDGTSVTAANVVSFVGHDEYLRYHDKDNPKRKALLGALAATLFHAVVAARDPLRTLEALGRASASGHLYLWSADPGAQAALASSVVGGALPAADTPYLEVLTQNFGGNKLDVYLRRTVRVTREADGFLKVQVTLRSTVPPGLPAIVAGRADRPEPPVPYGQNRLGLSLYGALSTEVRAVQVDGRPALMSFDRDHGHRLGTLTLELPPDRDVVVTTWLSEPAGELVYRQQPLTVPDTVDIGPPHLVVGR